ncbi:sugar nucleotide-binding protein [Ginsengibacter hankyongi]|uniref:dTDP-4-dehydrorhamnose reductase n=2 Tax=Ginsengibacter hankyongi TaxID=2607284 RepID=A0A5J5IFG1_9BACT|nr:sugar nucleotide-binding protein [Ginsengibacter hankyongi]
MELKNQLIKPEIWGGIECTINRVENKYRDQLEYAGHYTRGADIKNIAALGIKALRYPVLWERHHSTGAVKDKWNWVRNQLETIRGHNITPIAGLVHHGSGPRFTALNDNNFAEHLAKYAGEVANQFPWIEYYTPINEPLTTARFSGLYGLWYPHHSDAVSFANMLLNQLKGVVLSMKAIRKINPNAKLVQTEDLAKTHSTPLLKYQALFENERHWLTFDILCGKVNPNHFFWNHFISLGIKKETLYFFLDNPCPPDIMGFNYYVTSERYLDEKIHLHPVNSHGGNGQHSYADLAAVRFVQTAGLKNLLTEAWDRYHLPIALTEVHLNCTREEQLRWFKEAWDTCCNLKASGIDIKAVTAWSMLGAFDWNSLLTRDEKKYESGVFDVSNNVLRPTALAKLITSLNTNGTFDHPLINEKGWWRTTPVNNNHLNEKSIAQSLLIIGKNGTLGRATQEICKQRNIPFIAIGRNELDIRSKEQIEQVIHLYKPWAIINAAGYVRVDEAESDIEECFSINATGPYLLAECCNKKGIKFMTFSSDLVFDGNKISPYLEEDSIQPLNIYGKSKARAESLIMNSNPSSLIIRTSAFFGPWDKYNFPMQVISSLKENRPCKVADDIIVSPTYVPDLVNTALDLFIDDEEGIWHLSNEGNISWSQFAYEVADRAGVSKDNLVACSNDDMEWKARRPLYSALQSSRGVALPKFENALQRFFDDKIV